MKKKLMRNILSTWMDNEIDKVKDRINNAQSGNKASNMNMGWDASQSVGMD